MNYNYPLKYKTFDELLAEVMLDFRNYTLEEMIDPQTLIKIARKTNKELGLRIYTTHEVVLDVEHRRAKLPDNFHVFNHALICTERTVHTGYDQGGTTIIEVPYQETPSTIDTCSPATVNCRVCNSNPCNQTAACEGHTSPPQNYIPDAYNPNAPYGDTCIAPRVFINCKNEAFELIQVIGPSHVIKYKTLIPLKMRPNPSIDCNCPNLYYNAHNEGWIVDNWLNTNFETGRVYLNYQSNMIDEHGNVLVPDHEILNEFYEYALKERIYEDLFLNGEDVGQKLQYVQGKLRMARNNAMSLVNTPNFEEMRKVWESNRKAMYGRYYDMFKRYPRVR